MNALAPIAPQPEPQPEPIKIPVQVKDWDQYFLYMAQVASIKSKDPRCSVGAVIVSPEKLVLSTGFNGLARGVHDDEDILDDADEKVKIICHAENNAILNAARYGIALQDATIYVTKFPCLACCNAIVQAGITRIYTHDHKFWDKDPLDGDHSRKKKVLHEGGIEVDAPFHPDYKPAEQISPNPKKPPQRVAAG